MITGRVRAAAVSAALRAEMVIKAWRDLPAPGADATQDRSCGGAACRHKGHAVRSHDQRFGTPDRADPAPRGPRLLAARGSSRLAARGSSRPAAPRGPRLAAPRGPRLLAARGSSRFLVAPRGSSWLAAPRGPRLLAARGSSRPAAPRGPRLLAAQMVITDARRVLGARHSGVRRAAHPTALTAATRTEIVIEARWAARLRARTSPACAARAEPFDTHAPARPRP
jgi:hypothetical protein